MGHAADGPREVAVVAPVQHHLGDGDLAVERLAARLEVDRLREALPLGVAARRRERVEAGEVEPLARLRGVRSRRRSTLRLRRPSTARSSRDRASSRALGGRPRSVRRCARRSRSEHEMLLAHGHGDPAAGRAAPRCQPRRRGGWQAGPPAQPREPSGAEKIGIVPLSMSCRATVRTAASFGSLFIVLQGRVCPGEGG